MLFPIYLSPKPLSAPEERASADRYIVACDFLDLTFYFSFAGLAVVGNWLVVAIVLTLIQAFNGDSSADSGDEVAGSWG